MESNRPASAQLCPVPCVLANSLSLSGLVCLVAATASTLRVCRAFESEVSPQAWAGHPECVLHLTRFWVGPHPGRRRPSRSWRPGWKGCHVSSRPGPRGQMGCEGPLNPMSAAFPANPQKEGRSLCGHGHSPASCLWPTLSEEREGAALCETATVPGTTCQRLI